MMNLKYTTALVLLLGLYGNNVHAYERRIINSPIKTAIYRAAVAGKPQIIERYLSLGYSINSLDSEGMSALCSAKEHNEEKAYALLLKYGANDKLECMQRAETLRSATRRAKFTKYAWGTLIFGGGIGGAIALSSGGSGGGSGSSGDSGDDIVGNGKVDTSLDWSVKPTPALDTTGEVLSFYRETDFMDRKEYSGGNFGSTESGMKFNSVNYLGGVNAAKAFTHFFGTDEFNNFASNLKEVTVGVIDTGVWGNHSEFQTAGGSKVTGYNFDYGPCLNGDTSHCWKPLGEKVCILGMCLQEIVLLDGNGAATSESSVLDCVGENLGECSPYAQWANAYPVDYDWDNLPYYFYPNNYNSGLDNSDDMHGTNVAGIIASNRNDAGNMGVAFFNTKIDAVRWDFHSNLYDPLKTLLDDNVLAVNMSLGTTASASSNASLIGSDPENAGSDLAQAVRDIVHSYTKVENNGKEYADGMILVKAAGNDSYAQPDVESGIKLVTASFDNPNNSPFSSYSDLLMLVVVSVDVKLDMYGTVQNYALSSFSNACGVTGNYCIAAPGGNEVSSTEYDLVYAPGQPNSKYDYIGMGGTSQATPVVTGSIAFLKGAYPYMSSGEIIELLQTTANKNASDYSLEKYGAGLLDLGAAVSTYVAAGDGDVSTVEGDNIHSNRVRLSDAHLVVTSTFKNALTRALPKGITVYDKYNRPFNMSMENYVTTTHSGYKTLKNDVYNISRRSKVQKVEKGGLSFAFAGGSGVGGDGGMGFVNASYKTGRNTAGFSFSENTRYDADNYFASGLKNPFMAFNSAYGLHNTFDFGNGWGFKLEAVTGQNGLYDGDTSFEDRAFKKQAYALNAELQLHQSKNFGVNLISGILYEDEALLGMNGSGAFDVTGSNTYNAGVSASWFVTPKLTLSGSYFQGFTQAQSFASNLLGTSDLVSESFAFDANYQWSKTMNFGLQVSSPLRVRSGTLAVNFPSGRDNYSDTVYRDMYKAGLKPEAREYKFSAYLNTDLSDKISLRSEMGVRIHPEHQNTSNDYRALVGLSWSFN